MGSVDFALMAHLMRRAGFGATRTELEERAGRGYDATVRELLSPDASDDIADDLLRRYHPDHSGGLGMAGMQAYLLYRMVHSKDPLLEKVALFWHRVFATGYAKLTQGRVLMDQFAMFREHGLGSVRNLLVELSRDPSMIIWLDNQDNHKGEINENYGRELLELFSMGVGNYTEDDVKECARALTGWTVANAEYMEMRATHDSLWPYGRINLHFEYRPDDHDSEEISFLGHRGRFGGEDVVDAICRQPATARFIARHMYNFFVADEPPVPQWGLIPPRDPVAIEELTEAYFESGYDVRAMLQTLFTSGFFKSRSTWFEKVKSPAELVAGVLRLTDEHKELSPKLQDDTGQLAIMGQTILNPPSVESWHEGLEWIDTGNLVERLNFASQKFADPGKPGIAEMIARFRADAGGVASPDRLVQGCLDLLGAHQVAEDTRMSLVEHATKQGDLRLDGDDSNGATDERVAEMLRLVASTPEFQRG